MIAGSENFFSLKNENTFHYQQQILGGVSCNNFELGMLWIFKKSQPSLTV
jgi:hypothetical protein